MQRCRARPTACARLPPCPGGPPAWTRRFHETLIRMRPPANVTTSSTSGSTATILRAACGRSRVTLCPARPTAARATFVCPSEVPAEVGRDSIEPKQGWPQRYLCLVGSPNHPPGPLHRGADPTPEQPLHAQVVGRARVPLRACSTDARLPLPPGRTAFARPLPETHRRAFAPAVRLRQVGLCQFGRRIRRAVASSHPSRAPLHLA